MKKYNLNNTINEIYGRGAYSYRVTDYAQKLVDDGIFTEIVRIAPAFVGNREAVKLMREESSYCIYGERECEQNDTPCVVITEKKDGTIVNMFGDKIVMYYYKADEVMGYQRYIIETITKDDYTRRSAIVDIDGIVLRNEWFLDIQEISFKDAFIVATDRLGSTYFEIIDKRGDVKTNIRFSKIEPCESGEGFIVSNMKGDYNMLNDNYKIMSDTWYEKFESEEELYNNRSYRDHIYVFSTNGDYHFFDDYFSEIDVHTGNEDIISYETIELGDGGQKRSFIEIEDSAGDKNALTSDGLLLESFYPTTSVGKESPFLYFFGKDDASGLCEYYDFVSGKLLYSEAAGSLFKAMKMVSLNDDGGEDYIIAKNFENRFEIYEVDSWTGPELKLDDLDGVAVDTDENILYAKKGDKIYLYTGNDVIVCDKAWRMYDGIPYYMIFRDNKYGLVDIKENCVVDWFDDVYSVDSYYPIVVKDGKYNYINISTGEVLFDKWYDDADDADVKSELFPVIENGTKKVLDINGNQVK